MTDRDLQRLFFFDLPLSDVYGVGCAAMDLIYYGSVKGVFGATKKNSVELGDVDAFLIPLKHRTQEPLSDEFDYDLIYYRREIGRHLWNHQMLSKSGGGKVKWIRRVGFSSQPSLQPSRLRRFFIKSNRPLHVKRCRHFVPSDDCIPADYIDAFNEQFAGYLVRSVRGAGSVEKLMDDQGLTMTARRNASVVSMADIHVQMFKGHP